MPTSGQPALAFMTDMERDEAARSGLELLGPARLTDNDRTVAAASRGGRTYRFWSAAIRESGLDGGRLALAGSYPAGPAATALATLSDDGFDVVDFSRQMRLARKSKTASELGEIERVAATTCAAMRAVASALATAERSTDGALLSNGRALTAGVLRSLVREHFLGAGLEEPEGNIVSAGGDAAVPHTQGADDRELTAGETIVVDLYPRGRGCFADCTRTFCVGEATPTVAASHALVRRALEESIGRARAGVFAPTLQSAVCDLFEEAGWETQRSTPGTVRGYVHGLGHGVGLELHEQPSFRGSGAESHLEVGDVFTLEPGLYDPEAGFGIRIEDLLYLDETGPVNLTPMPYDLDPEVW